MYHTLMRTRRGLNTRGLTSIDAANLQALTGLTHLNLGENSLSSFGLDVLPKSLRELYEIMG